jgi:hypothetical protein
VGVLVFFIGRGGFLLFWIGFGGASPWAFSLSSCILGRFSVVLAVGGVGRSSIPLGWNGHLDEDMKELLELAVLERLAEF